MVTLIVSTQVAAPLERAYEVFTDIPKTVGPSPASPRSRC